MGEERGRGRFYGSTERRRVARSPQLCGSGSGRGALGRAVRRRQSLRGDARSSGRRFPVRRMMGRRVFRVRRVSMVRDAVVRRVSCGRFVAGRVVLLLSFRDEGDAARACHVRRLARAAGHRAFVRRGKGTKRGDAREEHKHQRHRQKDSGESAARLACGARNQKH